MSKQRWSVVGFLFLIIGLGVSIYLVQAHYALLYGMAEGKSFCNVSEHMDCDAVNTSRYSEILGVPVAMLSAWTFLIELLLLIGYRAFAEGERQKLGRYYFYLTIANMAATLVMAAVSSLVLHTWCLFCISLYGVCFFTFLSGFFIVGKPRFVKVGSDLGALFKSGEHGARGVLALLVAIPVGAAVGHGMWKSSISTEIDKVVQRSVEEWKVNPKVDFGVIDAKISPTRGNPNGKMQIVEFSDFQCPHCRRAAPSLHAFVNAHRNDVYFIFQNYPLDPNCNPKMRGGGHDKACLMARAALCAHKQGKFEEAHDWAFEHQETLTDESAKDLAVAIGLDKQVFEACLIDPAVKDEVSKELQRGEMGNVQGTPTVFVNGKQLPGGFLIPVLESALSELK